MALPPLPSLAPLLTAVKNQLSLKTGLGLNLIHAVARNQTPRFQGDQDILLRLLRPVPEEGFVSGSGRLATVVQRPLLVTLRSRSQTDPSDADDLWLTDPALGLLALEDRVLDALHLWWPTSPQGILLTTEPMRLAPSEPEQKPGEGAPAGDMQWGETHLLFEMKYIIACDPTVLA
jgi:hypothetical protein